MEKGGSNCTVIIYTLAFWFILAASQSKYMDSNTHDQNTGSFRNWGKKSILLCTSSCALFLCSS